MPTGPGDVLTLIRDGVALTRGDVRELTGLSRMTVAQRLDALLDAGIIVEGDTTEATGGRRRRRLVFNTSQSRAIVAAVDTTHTRIAVTDLGGTVLAQDEIDAPVDLGPVVGARPDRRRHGRAARAGRRTRRGPVRGRDQPARPDRPGVRTPQPAADPARLGRLPGRRAPAGRAPRLPRADRERRRRGRPGRVRHGGLLPHHLDVPGQGLDRHRHRHRDQRPLLHRRRRRRRRHRPRPDLAELRRAVPVRPARLPGRRGQRPRGRARADRAGLPRGVRAARCASCCEPATPTPRG